MFKERPLVLLFVFIQLVNQLCAQNDFNRPTINKTETVKNKTDYNEICKNKVCVPKCCPEGKNLFGLNKVCKISKRFKNLTFAEVPLFHRDLSRSWEKFHDVVTLVPGKILESEFNDNAYDYSVVHHRYYLTEEGILHEEIPNDYRRWRVLNSQLFCIDYQLPIKFLNMTVPELRFLTVLEVTEKHPDDPVITAGLFVSCFFLFLVLVVYSLLHELRNLSGMVLMAYVTSLFGAFLLMATIQIKIHPNKVCKGLTFCVYFFFLASFCWMNIMSCDIWWTFRGYAKARPIHRRGEKFKFLMYCMYAWGLPAIATALVIIFNEVDMRPYPWFVTPKVPKKACFFAEEEKFLYLSIPMLVLILANWVFFCMTAFNIWRLHRATAVLDSAAAGTPAAHRSQKYRFLVYVKLSVIMGINWLLELASSHWPNFKGWYISDIYNVLIGLSIFLIFVCKVKIFRMLKKTFMGYSWSRVHQHSKSRSNSNTTESEISSHTPVCLKPEGPVFFDKR